MGPVATLPIPMRSSQTPEGSGKDPMQHFLPFIFSDAKIYNVVVVVVFICVFCVEKNHC